MNVHSTNSMMHNFQLSSMPDDICLSILGYLDTKSQQDMRIVNREFKSLIDFNNLNNEFHDASKSLLVNGLLNGRDTIKNKIIHYIERNLENENKNNKEVIKKITDIIREAAYDFDPPFYRSGLTIFVLDIKKCLIRNRSALRSAQKINNIKYRTLSIKNLPEKMDLEIKVWSQHPDYKKQNYREELNFNEFSRDHSFDFYINGWVPVQLSNIQMKAYAVFLRNIDSDIPIGLDLSGLPFSSFKDIENIKIEHLFINNCGISSLQSFSQNKEIFHTLSIHNNNIRDLSPLKGLSIPDLWICGNPIQSFKPLLSIQNLNRLIIDCHQLFNMDIIFNELEYIYIGYSTINEENVNKIIEKISFYFPQTERRVVDETNTCSSVAINILEKHGFSVFQRR